MLQSIRDRSQGLIVGVIVFLISLTFALFGIQSYLDSGGQVVVAEVEDEEIFLTDFQGELQQYRSRARSILGDSFNADDWETDAIRKRVLDELVNGLIVDRVVEEARVLVSDLQVAREIQQIPAFQDENGFDLEVYRQRISLLGMSQTRFEWEVRRDLARTQLRAGIAESEFVTRDEANFVDRLQKQKRDIGYAIIPATIYEDSITIQEDEIRQYYDDNLEKFRTEEKISLSYLEMDLSSLKSQIAVSDNDLRESYQNDIDTYTTSETRNVQHITIAVPRDASDEVISVAREEAERLRARAEGGGEDENFEELIEEASEHAELTIQGGETGFFAEADMTADFGQAAFKLVPDQISQPVRSDYGFHIIKLLEIDAGGTKPFDLVRNQIEESFRAEQAQRLFFERVERLTELTYEFPEDLQVAADELGIVIQSSELLDRKGISAQFSEKFAAAVFDTDVLLNKMNSEPVELEGGRVVSGRILQHDFSRIPALSDVRREVERDLRNNKTKLKAQQVGEQILKELRAGGTVRELILDEDFGWEVRTGVSRETEEVNSAVLRESFRVHVSESEPTFFGIPVGSGDYAIVRVANVVIPAENISSPRIDEFRREFENSRSVSLWRDFLSSVRAETNVEIYPDRL